jgi:hypothetical protein
VRCQTQWGAIDGVEITVPPGRHDADDVGLFHQLEIIAPELGTPLSALLAPHRFEVAGGPEFSRLVVASGATTRHVREGGLNGVLFTPEAPRQTGVLCLSGSGGGWDLIAAGALAAHGYVSFALSYLGLAGQPDELVEIPLELVEKGLIYLQKVTQTGSVAEQLGR